MSATSGLWSESSPAPWRAALDRYPEVIARQGVSRLPELDGWYREALPRALAEREPPHAEHAELVRLTEWKMARGVWRAPNLVLVQQNDPRDVIEASTEALRLAPDSRAPIARLAKLGGVGPATASALMAAARPDVYPFFDELVAEQVPGLGKLGWTLAFHPRYAEALRERAARLGGAWTPAAVERALWAHSGGKASAI
jgi:hypothetical protein